MWNVAETQLAIISGEHARQRVATRGERMARVAQRRNRDLRWQPDGRPPDPEVPRRRPATA
ncbi:hypothetical protein [Kibdelosporangium aridum]|uniref:hypothetical protein n=1 Tax=Kibdelosporangium aridum TaxID=2030 RepID=UPI0035EE46F9